MYELVPIVAGLLAGLGAASLGGRRAGLALIAATALTIGPFAAVISGEISASWAFVLWDTAQAFVVGLAVYAVGVRFASRRST
jgi:hypothetical protein